MTPALRAACASQAKGCAKLGSPFMEQLMTLLADQISPSTGLGQKIAAWDQARLDAMADSIPLRLAGGLHALALNKNARLALVYPPGQARDADLAKAVRDTLVEEDAHMLRWLESPPQTNEVRRAAVLIATAHWLTARFGKMMRVSEIGASGGLNLSFDFFRMDTTAVTMGPLGAPVRLAPAWSGTPPTQCPPYVTEARGVDLNPLDPHDPENALRLMAYLWPDQTDRLERTKAAIDLALRPDTEASVDRGDALDWLPGRLHHQPGHCHFLYSTIAWQYLPVDAQARGEAMIEAAGARATDDTPLAWFRMEPDGQTPGAGLSLRLWPGDVTVALGRVDFHGRWVDWQAPAP